MNRRKTGVNQAILADGNGETMKVLTATAKTGQVIIGFLIALGTLFGGVYVVVSRGVNIEIQDAVETMAVDENSVFHREMADVAEEEALAVAGALQDDLDVFEAEQKAQGVTIIRMEERQINLEKKMAEDKKDIIREIQRIQPGGGGG